MTRTQKALIVALVFLSFYDYAVLITLESISLSLGPLSINFRDFDRFLTGTGLILTLAVFLKMRKERKQEVRQNET